MASNSLWLASALALAWGCSDPESVPPPITPLPPGEPVEVLSDGATYVSSIDAVFRDGDYVLAWTEWTEAEAIGKIARLAPGCLALGDAREIFRQPLAPADRAVSDPVVIALEARGDRVAVITAGNSPASEGDAVLWIVDADVRSVPLGRLANASMTSTERALEVAYQSWPGPGAGPIVAATIDWTTLETTTRSFDAEVMYLEPGFGTTPGRVALGFEHVIAIEGDAAATTPLSFEWGERWVFPNAFGATDAGLAVVTQSRGDGVSELLEIERAGNFLRRRAFGRDRTAARLIDAGGAAALSVDADLSVEPSVRAQLLYTPPSSLEARIVAPLGDEVAFSEHYGYRSTIAGAFAGDEILAAFTLALGESWVDYDQRRPSELRVVCFDADARDLPLATGMLTEGEPPPPPIRDPSSCGPDGYDLSSPAYALEDGSFSLSVSPERQVTGTCTMYGGLDAIVRFTAASAGAHTFLAQGTQLWALQARSSCEDSASELACDELLDFHAPDPFGPPRDVRVPLEPGQTIWLVLDGCQSDPCSWQVTALPPLALGAACDGPAACSEGTACIDGFCTTPTPPSLESATVYHHARSWPDGTIEERVMVIARGSDLTRDAQRVLVWADPDEEPIALWASSEDASFTLRASRGAPIPAARIVRVAVEDATGLRSDVIVAPFQSVPIHHLDELCDRDEIENVCAAGLACTEVSPGTTLCR